MTSAFQLQRSVRIVRAGGIIAYPTEAVWGLGCDPWNGEAVERLLALKQRPWQKGLILVAADIRQFDFLLADLPSRQREPLLASWPGPYTWLVPHRGRLPLWITGEHPGAALRVSAHPLVRALCRELGPLVSSSANPAGRQPARNRLKIEQYFHGALDAVLPGALGGETRPSRICDLLTGRVIRS